MSAVWTLALKDLRLLWRDKWGLFWVIGFPIAFALLFGSILGGPKGSGDTAKMKVAVIDDDGSADSRAFLAKLEQSDAVQTRTDVTLDEAKDLVRKGELTAYVRIEPGFGNSWELFQGGEAPFEVGQDPSRRAEAAYLQGILLENAFVVMRQRLSDRTRMREQIKAWIGDIRGDDQASTTQQVILATFLTALDQFLATADEDWLAGDVSKTDQPTVVERVALERSQQTEISGFDITFPSAILWSLMGCTASFAISLVTERIRGTLQRLRVAPLARGQIIAGKGLACFLAGLATGGFLILIGALFFGVHIQNPIGLLLALGCTAFSFTGLMMVFSVMGKTESAVAGAGWAVLLIAAMLGGGMIPLLFMPRWMHSVSNVSPVKWGIYALEGATWRAFSFEEMLLPCGILAGVGVIGFAVGTTILSRQQN